MTSNWDKAGEQQKELDARLSKLLQTVCGTEQECQEDTGLLVTSISELKKELDELAKAIEQAEAGSKAQPQQVGSLSASVVTGRLDTIRSRIVTLEDGVGYALAGERSGSVFAWIVFGLGVLALISVFYWYLGLHTGKFSPFIDPPGMINAEQAAGDKSMGKTAEKGADEKSGTGKGGAVADKQTKKTVSKTTSGAISRDVNVKQQKDLSRIASVRAYISALEIVTAEQAITTQENAKQETPAKPAEEETAADGDEANQKVSENTGKVDSAGTEPAANTTDTAARIHKRLKTQLAEAIQTLDVSTSLTEHQAGHLEALQKGITEDAIEPRVLAIYSEELSFAIETADDDYFWETGAGRYAEVLFGAFFGVMVFALYNWWKFMPKPGRPRWAAWLVAKIFLALMSSFVFVVLLSQISFTTPTSLTTGGAIGLGTAPIEMVIAVAILAGFFGHKAIGGLDAYTGRLFGDGDGGQEGKNS